MILDQLRRARSVGTPIIAITTADQPALLEALAGYNSHTAIISWDIIRGYQALNEDGSQALAPIRAKGDPSVYTNLVEALAVAPEFAENSMIVVQNGHRYLADPQPMQALMNLRNDFKATRRTILLLGPAFQLPAELAQDVLILDDPLPTPEAIKEILSGLYTENGISHTPEDLDAATGALRGLAAFPVEQAAALSITRDKTIDAGELWRRKRKMLEQVRGLSMEEPRDSLDDIGGSDAIKQWAQRLGAGPRRPRCFVFIDEIEKSSAGAGKGDTSGVSQDQLLALLTAMTDQDQTGSLLVGPAGTGKSAIARAMAASLGIPLIKMDLGAAKGSLVGESEQRIRAMMKAIEAIAGKGGACFLATCNGLDDLPPALRRRFWFGTWFFDLPSAVERQAIGRIHTARLGLQDDPAFWATCDGWSGANIHACCETAQALGLTLADAAREYIIAAVEQDPTIERLRTSASGRYLSAAHAGKYQQTSGAPAAKIRRLTINDHKLN